MTRPPWARPKDSLLNAWLKFTSTNLYWDDEDAPPRKSTWVPTGSRDKAYAEFQAVRQDFIKVFPNDDIAAHLRERFGSDILGQLTLSEIYWFIGYMQNRISNLEEIL